MTDFVRTAKEAAEYYKAKFSEDERTVTHVALISILEGIAKRQITRGQSILGELLLKIHEPTETSCLTKDESKMIRELFSCGMCAEGEELSCSGRNDTGLWGARV